MRAIWLRLGLAAIFAAVILGAWVKFASSPSPSEEEFAIAEAGVILLSLVLGLPALILAWSAIQAAQRTDHWRMVAVLAGVLVGGTILIIAALAAETSRPRPPAKTGSLGQADSGHLRLQR
jgi:hypothetical protein